MSHECCPKNLVMSDPCEAIAHGDLSAENYANFMGRGEFLLLLAQCGANATLEEISAKIDIVITLLTAIDANTDELEAQLALIIIELQSVNANLADIIIELQAMLIVLQNIEDNTDGIEADLQTIITLLTQIDQNTDELEALITLTNAALATLNACCAANNALLTTANTINGNILVNQVQPDLFGTHVVTTGTEAAAPAAGPYSSWVIVRTNALGTLTIDGIPLVNSGDSTAEEAQPQFKVPAPVIAIAGGATYAWRAKS